MDYSNCRIYAELNIGRKKSQSELRCLESMTARYLAKAAVNDTGSSKIAGHENFSFVRPYLQLDKEFHVKMLRQREQHGSLGIVTFDFFK